MSDTQLTIILTAVPATLVALGTLVATILNGLKSAERSVKVSEAVKEVHTIVNSKADASAKKIEVLQNQVTELLAVMAEKKETAALLAQAAASHAPAEKVLSATPAPTPVVVMNTPKEPLPVEDVAAGAVPKKKA